MREKIKEKLLHWRESAYVKVTPLLQRIDPYWQKVVQYKQIVIPAVLIVVLPITVVVAMQVQELRQHASGFPETSPITLTITLVQTPTPAPRVTLTPTPSIKLTPTPTPKTCKTFSQQGVCHNRQICTKVDNTCNGIKYINCYTKPGYCGAPR